nr:hypothetical protein [Tanacetum cinerariifolium]
MTRSSNTKVFTPFANPERQFQSRKDITPIAVHNTYSFYESESLKSESKDLSDIDIETLTLEQYLALNRNNSQVGVKKPEIEKSFMFEIKSQLLRELRENTFSGGKTGDSMEQLRKILEIASLFSTPGIFESDILLRIFPLLLQELPSGEKRIRETHANEEKLLKKLECEPVNTTLVNDIRKTPEYTWYLQELVSNKIQIEKLSMVKLNARCSALLQNKLPPKEKDPGSFVLPCAIGNTTVRNDLANLGASISVMSFSMFRCLGVGNLRPVNMVIEMADRSMQSPKGIVENVLVKIHKFIFPVDFVILDIVEDHKVPINLGRPMLTTAHPRIDVFEGKISLEVGKEQVIFNANKGATPISVSPICVIQNFNFNVMSKAAYNSTMKRELTYTGNNIIGKEKNLQVFIGCHSFLTNFIILENINEFVKKGLTVVILGKPFKEKIGLEEDISKGRISFKIGDDKTIFNMPRAKRRLNKLTTEQQNMMPLILKISDEYKAKGISHPYLKIKEFYKGTLNLGEEYKQDLEVIDWIKQGHASLLYKKVEFKVLLTRIDVVVRFCLGVTT